MRIKPNTVIEKISDYYVISLVINDMVLHTASSQNFKLAVECFAEKLNLNEDQIKKLLKKETLTFNYKLYKYFSVDSLIIYIVINNVRFYAIKIYIENKKTKLKYKYMSYNFINNFNDINDFLYQKLDFTISEKIIDKFYAKFLIDEFI